MTLKKRSSNKWSWTSISLVSTEENKKTSKSYKMLVLNIRLILHFFDSYQMLLYNRKQTLFDKSSISNCGKNEILEEIIFHFGGTAKQWTRDTKLSSLVTTESLHVSLSHWIRRRGELNNFDLFEALLVGLKMLKLSKLKEFQLNFSTCVQYMF